MYEDGEIPDTPPSPDHTKLCLSPRSQSPKCSSSVFSHKPHKTKYRSSDTQYRSHHTLNRSPNKQYHLSSTKHQYIELRLKTHHARTKSPDYLNPRKHPRSPDVYSQNSRYNVISPEPKLRRTEQSDQYLADNQDAHSRHSNRSPHPKNGKESPSMHKYSRSKESSGIGFRSNYESNRNHDDRRKKRSPEFFPPEEEFNNVIARMKTEKDGDPDTFNQNFEEAIEKEFSSEINKAMSYLILRFQVILEIDFDKAILEDNDKKMIMKRLENVLKMRIKRLKLNRFMLEMDIVTEYKNMYSSNDDAELVKKLLEDVTYVEIVEEEDVKPPPELDVDNRMWAIVEEVLSGLDLSAVIDDTDQTVILERIKEEHIDEIDKIKPEPLTATDFDPKITIKQEPVDPDTYINNEQLVDPYTEITSEPVDSENKEPLITVKAEPQDENELSNNDALIQVKTEPVYKCETPVIKTEPNPIVEITQLPMKAKKKHIRKVFDYPDITLKPIPQNPQFYITTKNLEKQMRQYIPDVSSELNLCLSAMDMLIVSDLIKAKLRKKIKKLLKNKTYMRSSAITKLFREHHPTDVDRKFVRKALKSFKKGPKPPKTRKKPKSELKMQKPDAELDEVEVIEITQNPIPLGDDETPDCKLEDKTAASTVNDNTADDKTAISKGDDKIVAETAITEADAIITHDQTVAGIIETATDTTDGQTAACNTAAVKRLNAE